MDLSSFVVKMVCEKIREPADMATAEAYNKLKSEIVGVAETLASFEQKIDTRVQEQVTSLLADVISAKPSEPKVPVAPNSIDPDGASPKSMDPKLAKAPAKREHVESQREIVNLALSQIAFSFTGIVLGIGIGYRLFKWT
jgi:hypothetical protein